jgi:hypothetical protein
MTWQSAGDQNTLQHTKNPKTPQNSFKSFFFRHFVWDIVKAPATSIALPLWPVGL